VAAADRRTTQRRNWRDRRSGSGRNRRARPIDCCDDLTRATGTTEITEIAEIIEIAEKSSAR
jgi:hypothetical protein